jgi:Protein of unknown function (DUF2612)
MTTLKTQMLSRLLNQWKDCPNWELFLTTIADYFADYIAAVVALQTSTWRDTSEGVWLDRVGEIVGVIRPMEEEVVRVFRCRGEGDPDYDPLHGFGDPSDPAVGGFLWGPNGIPKEGNEVASDETYGYFIDAKVAATNADASIPGLAKYVKNAFGVDCIITVPAPRQTECELLDSVDLRQHRYIEHFAPNVAGTSFRITNWPDWGTS